MQGESPWAEHCGRSEEKKVKETYHSETVLKTKITSGNERKHPVSGCLADISFLLYSSAEDFERKTVNKYSFLFAEAFFFSVSYPFMQNLLWFLLQNLTERLIFFLFPFFSQSFSQPSWKDNSKIKVGVAVLLYDIV